MVNIMLDRKKVLNRLICCGLRDKFGGLAIILVVYLTGGLSSAQAQIAISLTTVGTTIQESFSGFTGTAASLPTAFAVTGTGATYSGTSFTDGTSSYNTTNGIYEGKTLSVPTDIAFVAEVASGKALDLTFKLTNNTGHTLPKFQINYAIQQYQDASTASTNTIGLLSDNGSGGVSFNATNLTGSMLTATSLTHLSGGIVYTTPTSLTGGTVSALYNSPIANGASVEFQFQWNAAGSGNVPIWGVDNLSVQAVPEPATWAYLSVGLLALFGIVTRRRGQGLDC